MWFDNHSHTMYSSIRLLDSINRPIELIKKAYELGLSGIAITDHECLSCHPEVNFFANDFYKEHPEFTIALGNEIYLTDTRDKGQKYYHFILIAKDAIGHRVLRELSTKAWMHSYYDRGMERVPLLKSELQNIIQPYKGHLIATTACIGGELGSNILRLEECEKLNDIDNAAIYNKRIVEFMLFCKDIFADDFYLETAPACSKEQVAVNKRIIKIANAFDVKVCCGSDAHYLTKEDRFVHKAYLNSKGGDREVDSFYEYAHLQTEDEARENLSKSFDDITIDWIFNNSIEIKNKIQLYSLAHNQTITEVPVTDYPKQEFNKKYPVLNSLSNSDNIQERYWVNECVNSLKEKGFGSNPEYYERLEEEADTKRTIGEKLGTCMFAYPNTLKHYIDLFWECGSIVGAGRGSSCSGLNHWLLGITQLNPIRWNLPWFRYMNKERTELGDIDLDLAPSKRPKIIQAIKAEREQFFNPEVDEFSRKNLGCTLVATFGTETTKSAILTACRGYRSEDYPQGIDVDEAQYLSSLVPQERGFLWPIHDVVYGNPDKDRKPVTAFIAAVNQYPGLLSIIEHIEGLVNKRSSHASGVIFFEKDPFELGCFMRTPKGEIITQYDLHKAEACGMTKYDFLVTEVTDKLIEAIHLLQENGEIEQDLSLREVYNKYFHPEILPIEDPTIWEALNTGSVLNVFQFDSLEGSKAIAKIHPSNIQELTDANGLMRLMTGEKGGENPIDKYVRFKKDISLWYKEMDDAGLTKQEQQYLRPYFEQSYGVPPSQEQLMLMLMDKHICHFSLADANNARKIVGKKQMSKISALKEQVITQASSQLLGQYVWKYGAEPEMGYAFSMIHALAYSMIGVQTLYIATHWNPIYWNTACLIVNSGALEDNSEEEIVDIYAPEKDDIENGVTFIDLPDRQGKIRKTSSTDYTKIAKAIGDIRKAGINLSLVNINTSAFGFKPDIKNNQILYGFKAIQGVGDELVYKIIENRPYDSMYDFYQKVKPTRAAMVALIKSGAFDEFQDRYKAMIEFIWTTCDKKKRLTLQNMPGLIRHNLLPQGGNYDTAFRVYEFNRYLKTVGKINIPTHYHLDTRAIDFLTELNCDNLIEVHDNESFINIKSWEKQYNKWMDYFRAWIADDKETIMDKLNTAIFYDDWAKYGRGNLSSWEMETLCFYYHSHELSHLDNRFYGIKDFNNLPEEPIVDKYFKRGDAQLPIYALDRIAGTCISKNKAKSTVYLLTTTGVVPIKFNRDYFAMFDRQISEKNPDGTKTVKEKSWFNRGSMIVVQGIRRGNEFVAKNYKSSGLHQLYKIDQIHVDGSIELRHDRYQGEIDDE